MCRRTIKPGEQYSRFSATPHDEIWDCDRWTHMKAHHPYGVCAK